MPSRPSDEPELWLVQQAFLQDLVGGDSRTPEEREAVFQAPPRGSVEDRWDVYTSGYVQHLETVAEYGAEKVHGQLRGAGWPAESAKMLHQFTAL